MAAQRQLRCGEEAIPVRALTICSLYKDARLWRHATRLWPLELREPWQYFTLAESYGIGYVSARHTNGDYSNRS